MIAIPRITARPLSPLIRALRISYLYFRLWSVGRCIKHKRDGIEGMTEQIERDNDQVKAWGRDVEAWNKEIDALEKSK